MKKLFGHWLNFCFVTTYPEPLFSSFSPSWDTPCWYPYPLSLPRSRRVGKHRLLDSRRDPSPLPLTFCLFPLVLPLSHVTLIHHLVSCSFTFWLSIPLWFVDDLRVAVYGRGKPWWPGRVDVVSISKIRYRTMSLNTEVSVVLSLRRFRPLETHSRPVHRTTRST